MSPVALGAVGMALWFSPVLWLALTWIRSRRDHRPDPLFEDEEVARLEELWAMPARDHAA